MYSSATPVTTSQYPINLEFGGIMMNRVAASRLRRNARILAASRT